MTSWMVSCCDFKRKVALMGNVFSAHRLNITSLAEISDEVAMCNMAIMNNVELHPIQHMKFQIHNYYVTL